MNPNINAAAIIYLVLMIPAVSDAGPGVVTSEPDSSEVRLYSESAAFLLSLLGTTVPVGLAVLAGDNGGAAPALLGLGSIITGPSLGHFYADRPGRAWGGIGIRSASLFGLIVALAISWDDPDASGAAVLGMVSITACLGSMVWDIARAPVSAAATNRQQRRSTLTIGVASSPVSRDPGLAVAVSF